MKKKPTLKNGAPASVYLRSGTFYDATIRELRPGHGDWAGALTCELLTARGETIIFDESVKFFQVWITDTAIVFREPGTTWMIVESDETP